MCYEGRPTRGSTKLRDVVRASDSLHSDASEVVSPGENAGLESELEGVTARERGRAAEAWFAAEDDVGTVERTVDMILAGEPGDQSSCKSVF